MRMRDRLFLIELATYIGFTLGIGIGFLFNHRVKLFHIIHFLPAVILVLKHIDSKQKQILDEFLIVVLIGFTMGILLISLNELVSFILDFNLYAYLLMWVAYIYITYVINKIIMDIKKRGKD